MSSHILSVNGNLYYIKNLKTGTYPSGPTARNSIYRRSDKTNTTRRTCPQTVYDLFVNGTSLAHKRWDQSIGTHKYTVGDYEYSIQSDQIVGLGFGDEGKLASFSPTNRLKAKLLAKIRARGVNLAMMLAEYRETAKLFPSLGSQFIQLTKAVLKRDPRILLHGLTYAQRKQRQLTQAQRVIANQWLQYSFAVKPLMSDMEEAMQDLAHPPEPRPLYQFVRASVLSEYTDTWPIRCLGGADAPNAEATVVQYRRDKAVALVYYSDSLLYSTLGRYGFTDVAGLAWELVPFSFMVDYWVNVGEYLSSLDATPAFTSAKWCTTTKHAYHKHVTGQGASTVAKYYSHDRSGVTTLTPTIPLYYKPDLSVAHILNTVALIRGLKK